MTPWSIACTAKRPSQGVAEALHDAGVHAVYLEGGITAWKAEGLPIRRKRDASENTSVTREHPKIDRIACPSLVRRFVKPDAEFIYVPPDDVAKVAAKVGGTHYDIEDVEFGHVGERCSFDAIVRAYDIRDAALDRLATIVRGADTSRPNLTPQCEGLRRHLVRIVGELSRRPRNAQARIGDVRRALCLVQVATARRAHLNIESEGQLPSPRLIKRRM